VRAASAALGRERLVAESTALASPQQRTLTIVAQDPSVKDGAGRILLTRVAIPAERLEAGPRGSRLHVIDYDSSARAMLRGRAYRSAEEAELGDPFARVADRTLLADPTFHAQNAYAIAARTLWRFEYALGRRASWSFRGHQLKIAPHAFADANAFYSREDEALMFGYFPGRKGVVFTALSHDIVSHETAHALLDGLRMQFMAPSSPDQAAFHEGFADLVAILSVFSLGDVVRPLLGARERGRKASALVHKRFLDLEGLRKSVLLGLAEEMGAELSNIRGQALRRSAQLTPAEVSLNDDEWQEPHRRGEVLVAAVLGVFVDVWAARIRGLRETSAGNYDRDRVAQEGADLAATLLTMCIRAIDYTPPVHLEFGDYLSAMLTADYEIRPDDSRYQLRARLVSWFGRFHIQPAASAHGSADGRWLRAAERLASDRVHFEEMQRNKDEMFRLVWANRDQLNLFEGAYSCVQSIHPCHRIAPEDGFALRETVAEVTQQLELSAGELRSLRIEKPAGMPDDEVVQLQGGLTLVFDEFGRLKFDAVRERQSRRLAHLWENGHFLRDRRATRLSELHRNRALDSTRRAREEW
jgi:hypothetical protein